MNVQNKRFTLQKIVKNQLQSDVPIATFLSSGYDSSLVTAFSKLEKSDIKAFTFGLNDSELDESEDAKVGIRNARKDANTDIKKEEKNGTSEDICKTAEEAIQKLTDSFIKKTEFSFDNSNPFSGISKLEFFI